MPRRLLLFCSSSRIGIAIVESQSQRQRHTESLRQSRSALPAPTASCKRHDELQVAHAENIAHLISIDEIETGTGANQIGTLSRPCDTRWSSHFKSISSFLDMFDAICKVLENVREEVANYKSRGDAVVALKRVLSFEFIFIAHLMYDTFGITEVLCQALQQKGQDIVKAMSLVETTSILLQELKRDCWNSFIGKVTSFCSKHDIVIPDFNAPHFLGRSGRRQNDVTVEHYYHFDIFNEAINYQLQEIASRFNERIVELLRLSSCLNPKNGFDSFDIESICNLAKKYYPQDFSRHELELLPFQLRHFYADVRDLSEFEQLSSIAELCQVLVSSEKSSYYFLIDRLIRLILTLPVSTATTERAFSAMKIVKIRLRNKMDNDFLADTLVLYIEKDLAETFSLDSILDDFRDMKERRVTF